MSAEVRCYFCGEPSITTQYRDQTHKVDRSFGPFDLFSCNSCGSFGTVNPPSSDRLSEFYQRYDEFRPEWYKAGAVSGALSSQYKFYARHIAKHLPRGGTWADIGAGHGEVASLLTSMRPDTKGVAIDIGPRPAHLAEDVEYLSMDLNAAGWGLTVGRQFDLVFSVAVLEHVLSPLNLTQESLSLVAPGGRLVMITPDYGSLARRVLNRSWPYFEPGEHISIPSLAGARACVERARQALNLDNVEVRAAPLSVGYSLRYLFNVLRLKPLAAIIPPELAIPLPTGILSVMVRSKK